MSTTQAGSSKQCAALLEALRRGALTSIEIREGIGALSPAARVMQLRRAGYNIETLWRTDEDAQGRKHRVGVYVLRTPA
jgi:predicted DNA-binding ArsR family transcriptional regulator